MIEHAFVGISRVVSGSRVEWRCDPDATAQRIYFANHSSHLDFVAIWSAMPPRQRQRVRPVAGRDYWERGAVRRYIAGHVFNAVLIDRAAAADRRRDPRATIQQLADAMSDRHSLIVFPEGTRSRNGELGPLRSGLYHLARLRPDAELIPVYLENLHRVLPKGETLPVPMLGRVVFGRGLAPAEGDGKQAFLQKAREALTALKRAS